jgi:hypothetical protein
VQYQDVLTIRSSGRAVDAQYVVLMPANNGYGRSAAMKDKLERTDTSVSAAAKKELYQPHAVRVLGAPRALSQLTRDN